MYLRHNKTKSDTERERKVKLRIITIIILAQLLANMLTASLTVNQTIANTSVQNNFWYGTPVDGNIWSFDETTKWDDFVHVDNGSIQLIVGIDTRLDSRSKLKEIVDKNDGRIVNNVLMEGVVKAIVVNLPSASTSSFVKEVQDSKLSRYMEPNLKFHIQFVPNDPDWCLQWGPVKIGADWAWNITTGEPSVLVAVVDTGIYWNHSDLAANYVALGYDWVNNDTDPVDDSGHGTHCAGIIAAGLNNSIGVAGLAQIQIMAEKALDISGSGYIDWVASAIIHAANQGANIISMSWGGYFHSKLLYEAIRYAHETGALLVAAAGNSATDLKLYPAAYDEVIAVAATDNADNPASFTNFGDWIELAAPGVNIYSTFLNNGYVNKSGTSMATPHVVGVAALIWSQFPNISRDQLRFHLRYTADDLGDWGLDKHYGYGRINAKKAVEQTLPEHDLLVLDWDKPPYVELNSTQIVSCTILNFGTHNESDITVQLWANGTQVSNATISELTSGASATFGCQWSPVEEGKYNITIHVLPIQNETIIENNVVWAYVFAGFPVRAAVIRSAGTYLSGVTYTWETLNTRWHDFGDTIISIDYTALDKENITYEDIEDTNVDVLIISCAYAPENGWEFSNSEINAITRYVYEGHGLIVTAGTFYFPVPNNNKLTRLFGIDEATAWNATFTSKLNILEPEHPLFRKIPNPYPMSQWVKSTAVPFSGKWDEDILVGGKYVALGLSQESAIVTYRGLVYISPWAEISASQNDMQLFYNAITWSHYEKPNHDLIVSLEAPTWSPEEKRRYNVTVNTCPVPSEDNPLNNRITRLVFVTDPVIRPTEGHWANYTMFSVTHPETQEIGQMKLTYDHFISPYQINVTYWFKSSLGSMSTSWLIVNVMNRWVEKGTWAGWWYPGWIETNITLGSEVRLLDGVATVIGSRTIDVGGRPIDCWELFLQRYDANYTFYYDKPSGLWIGYYLVTSFFQENLTLTSTNILIGTLIRPKPGNYANYEIIHLFNDMVTATGTMNFTYTDYINSHRVHIKIEYVLSDMEGKPIENFTDSIIVNIQTRQIESGPESWNNTYYFGWIETFIELESSVNVWNQTGTVVGSAKHMLGDRLFNTWVVYSVDETQTCFYHYDQASGLLIKSTTNSLSSPSQNVTFTLLQTNVDVSPPFIIITSPQHNTVIAYTTVYLSWHGEDWETGIAYYLVYVDTGLVANVTHPHAYMTYNITGLIEGKHVIRVEAYDLEGNMDSDEVDIVIDLTGPTASIIAPSNGSYLKGDVIIINVTGSDAISFDRMELYINNFLTVTFLSEGLHSYTWKTKTYNGVYIIILIVYDKAGYQASAQITVTVDTTAPIAEIRQPAELDYMKGKCNVTIYAYDAYVDVIHLYVDEDILSTWNTSGTHTYTWDTATIMDCIYTVRLIVYDKAGNNIKTSVTVTVDNAPPVAEITLPINGSYIAGIVNVTFTFSDDNLENATLTLDGKILVRATEACSYMWDTTEIVDGEHIITLRAYDKAGNTKESTLIIFTDNTKPIVSITSPTNGTVTSGSIGITFTARDTNLINASLILDDTIIDVTSNTSFTLDARTLQDNTYTVKLIAFDLARNQAEDFIAIVVDNTDPDVSISAPIDGARLIGTVTMNFTAEDDHMVGSFLYIDNMMFNVTGQTSYEWDTSGVGDSSHIVKIVAIDEAGNVGETYITVLTMNVQKTAEESRIFGITLGILIGAIVGIAVGIVIPYVVARKHRSSKALQSPVKRNSHKESHNVILE